jgi:predicted regulator of Ras-like GTPase activity (Roadblock/LC7/MglB family)
MSSDARVQLLDLLEEIGAIQGVRGALIASVDGAFADGARSGLEPDVALDVAKTVRRMTVASATVGAPLEELLINFGAARMLVVPIREDGTLVVLLERDAAVESARSLLRVQLDEIQGLLEAVGGGAIPGGSPASAPSDEIARVLASDLGPVLGKIQEKFASYVTKESGHDAADLMREQMREWLLCCNPSPYTFPLLLDGLAQVLDDAPDVRAAFMAEVQAVVRSSELWSGAKGDA